MKSLLLTSTLLLSVSFAFGQQKEKPAAQGYIQGQPSNYQQDKALKELEKQENESYRPQPAPQPEPDKNNSGNTKETPKQPATASEQ